MVKFWRQQLVEAIKITKTRVAMMEKHGIGQSAIQEKAILTKQEKQLKDWDADFG